MKYVIPQPLFSCAWKFSFYFQWVLAELWLVWQVVGSGSDRSRRLKQLSSSARSQPTVGRGLGKPSALCSGPAGSGWGEPTAPCSGLAGLGLPGQARAGLCGASILCLLDVHSERLPALCSVSSALRREVESLTQEQSEARRQADKDRAALLSQMRLLEAELEEQLSHQQACAQQAEELAALRQQIDSLDQHLRRQRQFMDVSLER